MVSLRTLFNKAENKAMEFVSNIQEIYIVRTFDIRLSRSAHLSQGLDADAARKRIEETLQANANRPLFTGTAVSTSCLAAFRH